MPRSSRYRAYPDHVASLVLASSSLDIPAWERNAKRLLETLSDSSRKAVAEASRTGRFESPGYKAAAGEFWAKRISGKGAGPFHLGEFDESNPQLVARQAGRMPGAGSSF